MRPTRLIAAGSLALVAVLGAGLGIIGERADQNLAAASPVGVPRDPSPPTDELAEELDRRLIADVAPILDSFCLSCHAGDKPKADLRLDGLTSLADAQRLDLRLVRDMIASAEMPPAKKPQPSDLQRLILSQWLDAAIAYVPADAPIDPGWCTPHRLNRAEYRNTLRDLLGIDATDLGARLPPDDLGYGFDNIADALSVSPVAIEQYLAAAELAIDRALGPIVRFGDHPTPLRPIEAQHGNPLPRGGFMLYSNGPASARFTAPIAGRYTIRATVWETPAGDEHARASLRVGNRSIGEFDVSGTRNRAQELSATVRLAAGEHRVAVVFTNDYYVPKVADRNLAVESISAAGPLDEATSQRPAAWNAILGRTSPDTTDDDRAAAILGAFASRAYRRPADDEQVSALMGVYRAGRDAGDEFEPAVRSALSAALVSPRFLFRTVAHPDPTNPESRHTLDPYELASRLSYFIWSSTPDDALLASAADGSLLRDASLMAQVRRMLDDPRADALVENFTGQWLQLRSLDSLQIDRATFPEYSDALRDDMRREAALFVDDLLRHDRSALLLLRANHTFLNERLARHYGIDGVRGAEFRRVDLPPGARRGGVLTMAAVLTLTSNTTRTSPVKRGLFVLDQFLGAPPPPPPPDIPPLEQARVPAEHAPLRERLAAHTAIASCAACHNRLDPIGLSFEHFDAIGRWRDEEHGTPIDASGTLPGGIHLRDHDDLVRSLLDRKDQFLETLASKLLTYALGRGMEPFDRPAVRAIAARTHANGDRLRALVESVVLSPAFRTCRGRSPSP